MSSILAFKPFNMYDYPGHEEITLKALKRLRFCDSVDGYLKRIQRSNSMVDIVSLGNPAAHCDNEKLRECSKIVIRKTRKTISLVKEIDSLLWQMESTKNGRKYRSLERVFDWKYRHLARSIGSALHTLQDFYSHSNFVEKERARIDQDLVIFDQVLQNPSLDLKYCPYGADEVDPDVPGYTTGYVGRYRKIPFGKCKHTLGSDGIDKDTSSRRGFRMAVNLATSATEEYLRHIMNQLDNKDQRDVFTGCIE